MKNEEWREKITVWIVYDNGRTINQKGSDAGIIIADEEFEKGARITIEKNGLVAPYSFTCGIYGLFVHTAFFANEEIAKEKFESAKHDLEEILLIENEQDCYLSIQNFVEKY
jgi:hypothetical protein